MTGGRLEVLAVGEALALLDPVAPGPLEDVPLFALRIAGAEMNALIGLSRLGHSTGLVSAVGDDPFGRLILRTLEDEGVDATRVDVSDRATGVFFKERSSVDGRQVHYYRDGSAASAVRVVDALDAMDAFDPEIVIASGLTLGLGDDGGLGTAAAALIRDARARGRTVVFDANLRPGIWDGAQAADEFGGLSSQIDFLLAGEEELSVLFPGDDRETLFSGLFARGLQGVVVKCGREGSTVHTPDGAVAIAPDTVRAIDAVGAGDAFAAGFVSGLLRGWPLERAARLGSAMGAHAVTGTGDWESLPRGAEARDLVRSLEDGLS